MVKKLSDISLFFIQNNLHKIDNIGSLPTVYKELILERIVCHDLLTDSYVPHMTKLFSKSLTKVNFYKCEQISDYILKGIAASGCKLESLSIKKCCNITGKLCLLNFRIINNLTVNNC